VSQPNVPQPIAVVATPLTAGAPYLPQAQRVTAQPARPRARHRLMIASFIVMVLVPIAVCGIYLWTRASDQFASKVGFSVHTEEITAGVSGLLGGLTQLSGSTTRETDILYEYIHSQQMVAAVDAELDLRTLYSQPENDPVFSFNRAGTIEDLTEFWHRMVKIFYDSTTGLIELRVLAFQPQDAQEIATVIFRESDTMINMLSAIAREDTTRYVTEELTRAEGRLSSARAALTAFRSRTQIVDPAAAVQGQMGLLNTLQQQLAEALIESDLLRQTSRESDPRVAQFDRRIAVIQQRIDEERMKFGLGSSTEGGDDFATVIAEFERLTVEREFAEQVYLTALASFDAARIEAHRQTRYLAAYLSPTLAERAAYPQRTILLGLVAIFALLGWGICLLIFYSVRDRH
jgi:capsular polysaccharide transport system permease protein